MSKTESMSVEFLIENCQNLNMYLKILVVNNFGCFSMKPYNLNCFGTDRHASLDNLVVKSFDFSYLTYNEL